MWRNRTARLNPSSAESDNVRFAAADWQTCTLALLSSVLLEIAAADGQPKVIHTLVSIGIQAVLLVVAHQGCRRWARLRAQSTSIGGSWPTHQGSTTAPSDVLIPVIIGLGLLPFLIDGLARFVLQTGGAFELTLMAFMRNLVLSLAAAAVWPTYRQTATGLSVLLAIFASSVGNDRAMIVLLALYAIVGMWWLMGMYWGRLSDHLAATSERSLPRRWLVLIPLLVLLLAVGITSQAPQRTAVAFAGIAPTSGGTQWHDEFARGGIGDGDALVTGTHDASSFGPVESDLFLDSEDTSLYDAFNDTYGEPLRKPKNGRAVPLPASLVKEAQERMAKVKQANREFSTVRQMTPQRRELDDVKSEALLYVSGRAPLHLRLETFDLFDGEDWYPTELREVQPALTLAERNNKPWILLEPWSPTTDIYDGGEHHVLKLMELKSTRLPLPINDVALHIDRVDRPELFRWAQDGVVQLATEEMPAMTVLHTFSRVIDRNKLRTLLDGDIMGRSERVAPLPTDASTAQLCEVAQQWAGHLPRDWGRVETVVTKLRSEFVHDRNETGRTLQAMTKLTQLAPAASPGDLPQTLSEEDRELTPDSVDQELDNRVARFVLHDKRGPDYLFASAACLMLRSLGFSTRLASGLYVDPEKYDAKRRHIPVTKSDVHVWCEIYLGARTWVPIEPTPGYELLAPPLSVWTRTALLAKQLAAWCRSRAVELSLSTLVLVVFWWNRWRVLDVAYRGWWSCRRLTTRERILVAHQLMLLRSRWSGRPKPAGMTTRKWYATQLPHQSSDISSAADAGNTDCDLLAHWTRYVDWACFAPASVGEPSDATRVADDVLKRWSLDRLSRSVTSS